MMEPKSLFDGTLSHLTFTVLLQSAFTNYDKFKIKVLTIFNEQMID